MAKGHNAICYEPQCHMPWTLWAIEGAALYSLGIWAQRRMQLCAKCFGVLGRRWGIGVMGYWGDGMVGKGLMMCWCDRVMRRCGDGVIE